MSVRKPPLFLARRSYRRRRLRDAARLLPVFGGFLVFLPILWAPAETGSRDTAPDGIYLFAVWAGLIVVAALMSVGLDRGSAEDAAGTEDEA
ncbi:hypothetical protein [Rhodobacter ferrooxidans]|uniref:Uncharacterized protein n=1 Tax=Rhodobacter ferrooxidans TaxID=371731 RepID=C8S0M8_9RHOB|nr:hypothetical protein [Rhodobacter sp. SW2]EEW25562.1 conserved hypothetical protein [Rhodobacter sp. SW2]